VGGSAAEVGFCAPTVSDIGDSSVVFITKMKPQAPASLPNISRPYEGSHHQGDNYDRYDLPWLHVSLLKSECADPMPKKSLT
jgi:hypothetical protein